MTDLPVVFGFGAHPTIEEADAFLDLCELADRHGLDIVSMSDHPYIGERLDAYASLAYVLGRTNRLAVLANVTNSPLRPAPVLARTVTTLSALSGDRLVLGMGAGGAWQHIARMGVDPLGPADAVDAFAEAIELVRALSGGGEPVTFAGRHHRVIDLDPSPVPTPAVWTGSVGAKSLAVTGRLADGWIPGHAADWLSERYRTSRPIIDTAAVSAGRRPDDVGTIFNFPGIITEKPLPATRSDDGRWIGGSPDQWVEELSSAVREHRARGFILFSPDGGTPDHHSLQRWGCDIAPAIRQNIAQVAIPPAIGHAKE